MNAYAYVSNNPLKYADPLGLEKGRIRARINGVAVDDPLAVLRPRVSYLTSTDYDRDVLKYKAYEFRNADNPLDKFTSFIDFGKEDWKQKLEIYTIGQANIMIENNVDPELAYTAANMLTAYETGEVLLGSAFRSTKGLKQIYASSKANEVRNIKLYRAVSIEEYEQLMKTGKFEQGPNSLEVKFFAENVDDAITWGNKMNGSGNFKVIEIEISEDIANSFMKWDRLDNIGPARAADINKINDAGFMYKEVR